MIFSLKKSLYLPITDAAGIPMKYEHYPAAEFGLGYDGLTIDPVNKILRVKLVVRRLLDNAVVKELNVFTIPEHGVQVGVANAGDIEEALVRKQALSDEVEELKLALEAYEAQSLAIRAELVELESAEKPDKEAIIAKLEQLELAFKTVGDTRENMFQKRNELFTFAVPEPQPIMAFTYAEVLGWFDGADLKPEALETALEISFMGKPLKELVKIGA